MDDLFHLLVASTLPDVLSFPRFCTGLAWKLAKETQKPPEMLLPQRLKNGHLSRIETDVWHQNKIQYSIMGIHEKTFAIIYRIIR